MRITVTLVFILRITFLPGALEGEYGKHAKTHYKVLERFGYISLVECKLETCFGLGINKC